MTARVAPLAVLVLLLAFAPKPAPAAAESPSAAPRGGVGMQVVPLATGDLVVLRVLEGSPAQKLGIEPGDVIRSVNGHRLRGTKFEEVAKKWLWGEPGKPVEIALQRPGRTGTLRLTLTRVPLRNDPATPAEVIMLEPKPPVTESGGKK